MRIPFLSALVFLATASQAASRTGYATFGPMIHWNFSGKHFVTSSWGFELAYWSFAPPVVLGEIGYGLALGFDLDREAVRLYSEPQVGWMAWGLSLGPVLEMPLDGGPPALGVQGSGWANALLGADFRYRSLGGKSQHALGLYGKAVSRIAGGDDTTGDRLSD